MSPQLARMRSTARFQEGRLVRVDRKWLDPGQTDALDPQRTSATSPNGLLPPWLDKVTALEFESSTCQTGVMSIKIQVARSWTLSGRVARLMMISVLMAACGVDTVDTQQIVAGRISTDRTGSTRALTPSEVATLSDWLAQHR